MTKARRALFLFPSDRMGGAERITRTMAVEAARSGAFDTIDCFILCRARSGTLDGLEQFDNVKLHYTLARNEGGGIFGLLRILARRRYDLVFSSLIHLNAVSSAARWIGLLRTKRLVARESTMMFERTFKGLGRFYPILYRLYGKQDLIICQTDRMKESLDANTHHRLRHLLTVIPNPIDTDRIAQGLQSPSPEILSALPADKTLIAWCGRLLDVKNPQRAVDVLKVLHGRGATHMHLVFIGDGPLREATENYARQSGLSEYVTFTDYLANPIPAFMLCKVGLLTSDIEGFPNVFLEMLASGIYGIATTDCAGGLDSIPSVHVAQANTAEALADTLERIDTGSRNMQITEFLDARDSARFFAAIMGNR
ncbi:glycosyltransferase [Sphingopyxis sp. JAI128]|uniref:glycosyltransferase n=1 Tax=Sphingopyxis sp. JAI128 TaxID=2723066 RepID=UPI00161BC794|nr:glycosyltransferase [Sphingopyxis sp. JAI128]MBB6424400.1 glycosyltransferase involved in cell wall biosynthesis [Sphingopyxis sp. JAI128]